MIVRFISELANSYSFPQKLDAVGNHKNFLEFCCLYVIGLVKERMLRGKMTDEAEIPSSISYWVSFLVYLAAFSKLVNSPAATKNID
jgi:hypothetical protein